ncbi:MAG TPA: glycosyltransferase, partial [Patescibacteria group bacterium]|nr:glycosyltransferase [Patescibacteria group bacterium]
MAKKLKVAIVHDWLVGGGAERVVEALHRMYPDAPIYTSYCTPDWQKRLDGKVVTGFLQRWPFSKLRKFVAPLRIWWFTHLDFSGYNLVISSSGNGEAKGIRVPEGTTHVCYCHSPTHFYWRHYNLYIKNPGFGMLNPVARLGLRLLVGPLRKWDLKASQRPDYYIANSSHIQADIKKYYGRDAVVINPPVDVERFAVAQPAKRDTFVIAGRQVPQKKFDLVVAACSKASLPLLVLGKGPEHKKLVAMAGPTVNFVEEVSDSEMPGLIAGTNAFIFPCFDDFGIIPVEAMATGTPVIAFKAGGALDYVIPGKTGEFFDEQTIPAVRKALRNFDPKHYRPAVIQEHAAGFSAQVFRDK